ncbi:agmatine deiminase family protein [Seonamhaeicola aphaedonensis]|uniref:Agmatine deiminase n=1 Tax=Seonamhaeicola aphaedonensis TaxID=1461338 RepID=A0A3D9HKN6_9FLAO|nr:agmatine deiminase family protein [Seonamhaeicola aphaedonensis]RED49466.1 agmatine deiminase [Seonamhaeicola aphaedonensis]
MKAKIILLACLVMAASFGWFFLFFDQDYQPSTDFDETESHLLVWSRDHKNTYINFIKYLADDEHVSIYVPKSTPIDSVFNALQSVGVNMDNVQLEPIFNEKIWIRDFGPVFLMNKSGKTKTLSFKYSDYEENSFPYEYQDIMKERLRASRIIGIGGARELNGKGLAILVEKHEQAANPKLSKDEIFKELKEKLGIKKIIWLKSGLPQDEVHLVTPLFDSIFSNGAGHHIDSFCRFISPNTLLLAKVDSSELDNNPIMKTASDRLEENYNILKNASDQDGNPLNIIRVPMAPLLFEIESYENTIRSFLRSTSYLNFIITKNKVIVPSYAPYLGSDEAISKDAEIEIIFKSIFPEKKIVMLDCVELNRIGGGFHCISINRPKKKKKKKIA